MSMLFWAIPVFSGGKTESGRDSSFSRVEVGQVVDPVKIDVTSSLNDFPFPYTMNAQEDMSVFVTLEKNAILTRGDSFNLLVGLKVNNKAFFNKQEGNYIVHIHNPALLRQKAWKNAITKALTAIRQSQESTAVLGIYDPATTSIIEIPTVESIPNVLSRIEHNRKTFPLDTMLNHILTGIESLPHDYAARLVWISDADLLKTDRDIRIFNFFISLYAQHTISFSYFGYFETPEHTDTPSWWKLRKERQRYNAIPDWAFMNDPLIHNEGNSYFIQTLEELEETILDDYDRFVYPTVGNIKITLALKPWISQQGFDFRPSWYPLENFRPLGDYYQHTYNLRRTIKNMDYDEHRLFLFYLAIGLDTWTEEQPSLNHKDAVLVGFCSVEYDSYKERKTIYKTYPLQVKYTEDYSVYYNNTNAVVSKYTILQNTGFILQELSQLVNRGDYYTAILLADSQIRNLEPYRGDIKIDEDIETLKKHRDLLLDKQRSRE
jgi:hypothetical protein